MDTSSYLSNIINILIVDDRPENIYALRAILDHPRYNVVSANSGAEALRVLLKQEFALILMDIFMPDMDGFEVLSIIKDREKTRHIPIIFLTAMSKDLSQIYKAYSIGAVDYIHKPLEAEVVKAKVAVFADLYRKTIQIKDQAELIRLNELREKERQIQEIKHAGEKRYLDLVEGIDHGIVWSVDPETLTFRYVSPRAEIILGYSTEQWFNEPGFWSNHLHPEERMWILDKFRKAQMGQDLGFEHRFFTNDGEVLWFHTGIRLARKGEGVGYEIRGLSVDITPLKNIEGALIEAIRVRDEFLSVASHELKTPLTPLNLQIQLLIKHLRDDGLTPLTRNNILKMAEICNTQIIRLSQLIDELLDVSKIRAGRLDLRPEQINLSELLADLTNRYCHKSQKKICEVKLVAEPNIIGTWDRNRLEQAFTNLLSNALKYGEGKPIEITAAIEDSNVHILVHDHGVGIAERDQARIFERFERAVESNDFGGLGLGLYITRQIIEGHKGFIRLESKLGQGSVFEVTLPLNLDKAFQAA